MEQLVRQGEQLARQGGQLEFLKLQAHKAASFRLLPSSAHSSKFSNAVKKYYCGTGQNSSKVCCLSGKTHASGAAPFENVIAAHIIATADTELLTLVNEGADVNHFLYPHMPQSAILLQKKYEVLFDRLLWCFLPKNPLEQDVSGGVVLRVHVFVKVRSDNELQFLQGLVGKDKRKHLGTWIAELQGYNHKDVAFGAGKVPSLRALSAHAVKTITFALSNRWLDYVEASNYNAYADLSPSCSVQVVSSREEEGASESTGMESLEGFEEE